MALPQNKKTGRAIADIQALYFLKHVDGEEPVITENLENPDWFPVLTLRGTVNTNQDPQSLDKILVDQFDAPIGITTEPGDFSFEAQLPSLAKTDIEKWLGQKLVECKDDNGDPILVDGKQLYGFSMDGSLIDLSVLIKTRTGDTFIFAHVMVSLTFGKEEKVFIFRVNGQVVAPSNEENEMIYYAHEKAVIAPTGVSLNKSTLTLEVGANETLEATVAPANASNKKVAWTSSDTSVATVDAYGKVVAVGAGTANITATSKVNSSLTATCAVTVTAE